MQLNKVNEHRIMVVGDTHGDFGKFKAMLYEKKPKLVIQTGDFGMWLTYVDDFRPPVPVYFCDGNHEDHNWLASIRHNHMLMGGMPFEPIQILPNVFYCPRGSTLTLPDGRKALFAGGAFSIDYMYRTPGYDWFDDEKLTMREVDGFPDHGKIDVVFSHTCPISIISRLIRHDERKDRDESNHALEMVLERYRPSLWYLSHWHVHCEGIIEKDCHFEVLNMLNKSGWWNWIK